MSVRRYLRTTSPSSSRTTTVAIGSYGWPVNTSCRSPLTSRISIGAPSPSRYARFTAFCIFGSGKGTRGVAKKVMYSFPGLVV